MSTFLIGLGIGFLAGQLFAVLFIMWLGSKADDRFPGYW